MAFIYDENNDTGGLSQIYDVDRDLEFVQGASAYGEFRGYFRSYKNPDTLMGGGIKWRIDFRDLTAEEEEKCPDYVKGFKVCIVERFNSLVTVGVIKGCNLAETIEIIREAMVLRATYGLKESQPPYLCEVVFGPDFDLNEGDK